MDMQLRGKRALVTGSTAGIGFAAAAGLFREGASVVLNGRTPQRVEEAVAKVRVQGDDSEVSGIAADFFTSDRFFDHMFMLTKFTNEILNVMTRRLGEAWRAGY